MHVEAKLALVTRRQHGVFTRAQAVAAGMSGSAVDRGARRGRFVRLHQGVFADAAFPRSRDRAAIAAVLACGRGAALSHLSAARLWQLDVREPRLPEVTVARRMDPRRPAVLVHRSRCLARTDVARLNGIVLTRPMRTLADIAARVEERALELALDSLWRRTLVRPDQLAEYIAAERRRRLPGAGVLARLANARLGLESPRSELEARFLQVLADATIPPPDRNVRIVVASGVRYLDFAYPAQRIAIELDGFERHQGDRAVFDDDRVRQNEIEATGYAFRRFTWTHVTTDPAWVQMTVGRAIGLGPGLWRPAGA